MHVALPNAGGVPSVRLVVVAPAIPDRVRWAVETLALGPADHVLEIGCGSGLAAALICERLVEGRMLAIDRSATQIERARRRNQAHIASGRRLRLETVALACLDTGGERFDRAFAINVNLFWLGPAREELDRIRRALRPGGTLHLFYQTPGHARGRDIGGRIAAVLRAGRFVEPEIVVRGATSVCFISSPR